MSSFYNGKLPPKADKPREMKVLALNISRTGTDSVKAALEQLECNCVYHGFELMKSQHGRAWEELCDRKFGKNANKKPITREDFEPILRDFEGVAEMPVCAFWEELMDAYPDAKIVLVERDVDKWYPSFYTHVIEIMSSRMSVYVDWFRALGILPDSEVSFLKKLYLDYFQAKDWKEMESTSKRVYQWHYNSIAAKAEATNRPYLRMGLEQGWEPLCKFLNKPIPENPFPRINEGEITRKIGIEEATKNVKAGAWVLFSRAGTLSAAVAAVYYARQYYLRRL